MHFLLISACKLILCNDGRVGLALLRLCEDSILDLPFEQMLAVFKSKQCPAFAHSPDVVMKLAYSFRVSKRLAQFKAMYDGSSLPAEAEAAAEEERKNMKQHYRSVQQLSIANDADSDWSSVAEEFSSFELWMNQHWCMRSNMLGRVHTRRQTDDTNLFSL